MKMRKAFFFTMDALLAATFSVIVFTLALEALEAAVPAAQADAGLARLAEDVLAGMEKNGVLEEAARTSSGALLANSLGALPPDVCARAKLKKHQGGVVLGKEPKCKCRERKVTSARSFVVATNTLDEYVALVELCKRKEK